MNVIEDTEALPGFGLPAGADPAFTEGKLRRNVVIATIDDSDPNALKDLVAIINWGDGQQSAGRIVRVAPNKYEIVGDHLYHEEGVYHASVGVTDLKRHTHTIAAFRDDVSAPKNEKEGSLQDNLDDGFWTKLAPVRP
jgi:hypothetical protein